MQNRLKAYATIIAASGALTLGACGGHGNNYADSAAGNVPPSGYTASPATAPSASADTQANADSAPEHHSKLKGALVGAAAGHVLGHHAIAGAAIGALVQHERNKKR